MKEINWYWPQKKPFIIECFVFVFLGIPNALHNGAFYEQSEPKETKE